MNSSFFRLPVLDKKDFFCRWKTGEFGNHLKTWESPQELWENPYCGPIGIRSTIPSAGVFRTNMTINQGIWYYNDLIVKGHKADTLVLSESPDHSRVTLNAEVMIGLYGLEMTYSLIHADMVTAMRAKQEYCNGTKALCILVDHLNAQSCDDAMELLELYPGHVIELASFDYCLGSCRGRNTVIWEVRKY